MSVAGAWPQQPLRPEEPANLNEAQSGGFTSIVEYVPVLSVGFWPLALD